jgi:hypothetical protein
MSYSLDDIREQTRKKFQPFKITLSDKSEVTLASALKLSKDDRKTVSTALEDFNALTPEQDDPESLDLVVEVLSRIFTLVADKPAKLLKDLDDDDPMVKVMLMTKVLVAWVEETQLGEA